MKQFGIVLAALVLATPAAAPTAAAPSDKALVDRVNDAIEKGKKYLRSQRTSDKNWEAAGAGFTGAQTSLVILALLSTGVKPDDPLITEGLDYLRTLKPDQTYAVSLQTMAFALGGHFSDLERISKNVDWLVKARVQGETNRGWGYRATDVVADGSNTQYAILALHEARQAGVEVDAAVWRWVQALYRDSMEGDADFGAWRYRKTRDWPPSVSMTTAGLCGLLVAGMNLRSDKDFIQGGRHPACGKNEDDPYVRRALNWLGSHLPATADDVGKLPHLYYNLYGIERAGRLSGQRFLGGHDWYRIGCEYLTRDGVQNPAGWWGLEHNAKDSAPVIATSFALLFLSKGRTPVLVSKLAYGPLASTDWNNHRYDVRNLVDFTSRELFRKEPLAWQVFDPRRAGDTGKAEVVQRLTEDLLQSPVVFLSGHREPDLGVSEKVLKQYVENGGFILAEACCGEEDFHRGFQKAVRRLFGNDAVLEELGPNEPVWTASNKFVSKPDNDFRLYGVRVGCRIAVVYSPKMLSCYWEWNQATGPKADPTCKKAFELGANILAYATGLDKPPQKGTRIGLTSKPPEVTPPKGYLQPAQLVDDMERPSRALYSAPNAMRNLMLALHEVGLKDVTPEAQKITAGHDNLTDFGFLYLHGRSGKLDFSKEELQKLRFYLESPNLLLADACCGSRDFDKAFRSLMDQLWQDSKIDPKPKLEPIPLDDYLFSKELNGEAIKEVRCRRGGKGDDGGFPSVPPELEGVKVNGRWVVIYSKWDIGCALEKHKSSDCLGHDFESAKRLGMAAVLYALKR